MPCVSFQNSCEFFCGLDLGLVCLEVFLVRMASAENFLCPCWNVIRASPFFFFLFESYLEEGFLKTKSSSFIGIDNSWHYIVHWTLENS